jgi:hypothetical protein
MRFNIQILEILSFFKDFYSNNYAKNKSSICSSNKVLFTKFLNGYLDNLLCSNLKKKNYCINQIHHQLVYINYMEPITYLIHNLMNVK